MKLLSGLLVAVAVALAPGRGARGAEPTMIARGEMAQVAADDRSLVWAALDGVFERGPSGSVVQVAKGGVPALALDGDALYAVRKDGIWRRPRAGGKWAKVVATDDPPAQLVAVAHYLYWASPHGSIHRMPTSGGPTTTLATFKGLTLYVAVDGSHVYFSALGHARDHAVMRVPLAGGKPEVVFELSEPGRLVLDGQYLYVTCEETATVADARLVRLFKDGGPSQRPKVLAHGLRQPWDLFVARGYAYILVQEDSLQGVAGGVARVAGEGGTLEVVAGNQHGLWSMAHDRDNLYWSASGAIWSLPLPPR
jgi:hypothetical protein